MIFFAKMGVFEKRACKWLIDRKLKNAFCKQKWHFLSAIFLLPDIQQVTGILKNDENRAIARGRGR